MAFYPTPPGVMKLLKPLIEFPSYTDKMHALDPCCGEGAALASLATAKNVQTFGIELDAACAARRCRSLAMIP